MTAAAHATSAPDLAARLERVAALLGTPAEQLLDEWESLINPAAPGEAPVLPPEPPSVVTNTRAFRVLVRNELFRRVQLAALDKVPKSESDQVLLDLDHLRCRARAR